MPELALTEPEFGDEPAEFLEVQDFTVSVLTPENMFDKIPIQPELELEGDEEFAIEDLEEEKKEEIMEVSEEL